MNKYSIFKDPDFKEVFANLVEMRRKDNDSSYPDWFLKKIRKTTSKKTKTKTKGNNKGK